ncbi:MAG: TolC family protein [Gemmatimonadetes bacterium]|nr:TolC family protein [Gemmatimonadota bacterium]
MLTSMLAAVAVLGSTALGGVPPARTAVASAIPAAPDTVPPLTLTRRQAVATALAHNPQLQAAREQVSQARARVWEAVELPDPIGTYTPKSRAAGLEFGVPFPDKLRLSGSAAHSNLHATEFDYTQASQQIAAQTAQAYDALLVATRHEQDFRNAVKLADDFVSKTQDRYTGGTAAKLDVIKAKVDRAQAQNALIASRLDVSNARAALNRLLARDLGAPLQPADSLSMPDSVGSLESLLTLARQSRPDLRSLAEQRHGAHALTNLQREWWLPDLTVTLSRNRLQSGPTGTETDIGLSLPLYFWQHHNGQISEAKHYERELAATSHDLTAQVDEDVRTAYATAVTAMQQAEYIRSELLPEAQQAYHIASVSYGLGGSSALDVLDAERALIDAESQLAEALGGANDAIAQLQLAVGAPLNTADAAHTATSGGNQ